MTNNYLNLKILNVRVEAQFLKAEQRTEAKPTWKH